MKQLLLIHGAWHSSWMWDSCLPYLAHFCKPITLDMPGRKFSESLVYSKIGLNDYVEAIEKSLAAVTGPIYLLGHSLAGLPISQVAEKHPEKIAGLIYLTAFVPANQESMFDITKSFHAPGLSSEMILEPNKNSVTLKNSKRTRNFLYNECSDKVADQAMEKLTPEPLKSMTSAVSLSAERFGSVPKYYIKTLNDQALDPQHQDQMMAKTKFNNSFTLKSDHSPFLSDTINLCSVLEQIVHDE